MLDHRADLDMSDSDSSDHAPPGPRKIKRRRLHGACDTCRKKKIKCDSAIAPNNICSNCINSKVQCTHNIPRQKKKDTQQEYIRTLEDRLRMMETLLRQSQDSASHSPKPESSRSSSEPSRSSASPSLQDAYPIIPLAHPPLDRDGSESEASSSRNTEEDKNDLIHVELAERLKSLSMQSVEGRFFGQSSMFSLAQQVVALQTEFGHGPPDSFSNVRRSYFWKPRDWETEFINKDNRRDHYSFPEPDLFDALIVLYFERVYTVSPAVHRPTFEREIRAGKHLTDHLFGMVVLAALALGARYSDDPRVFERPLDPDGFEGSNAGWKWITQVPLWRNSLCDRTTLYDLQFCSLAATYYLGSSMPQICWFLTGTGLRLAQEKGLHRRKGAGIKPTVASETEKRVFWCLVFSDRLQGSFLGRAPALHDEDIDCEYPVEVDDEYWETEDPEEAFQQPPGKLSTAAAFTWTLKLCEIIGFMTRTLYSTKKSRIMAGLVGEDWEARYVTELDSCLNRWRDNLPVHLAWDPTTPDPKFFNQCFFLHCTYYYTQIQVHRPFLDRNTPLALSSRAICTNAARNCSRAVEVSMKRQHRALTPHPMMAAFISAMVLTLNFWSSKALGLTSANYDPVREMADIEKCKAYMVEGEQRWFVAGRLGDMITEFSLKRGPARAAVLAEEASNSQSHKRSRPVEPPQAPFRPHTPPSMPMAPEGMESAHPPGMPQTQPLVQQSYGHFMPAHVEPTHSVPAVPEHFGASRMQQPLRQQQRRHQNTVPNISQPRPMSLGASDQWDLSSLLMAQMGYDQLPGNNFHVTVPYMASGQSTPGYNVGRQAQQQHQPAAMHTGHTPFHAARRDDSDIFADALANDPQNNALPYADSIYDMGMWMTSATKAAGHTEDWNTYYSGMDTQRTSHVGSY